MSTGPTCPRAYDTDLAGGLLPAKPRLFVATRSHLVAGEGRNAGSHGTGKGNRSWDLWSAGPPSVLPCGHALSGRTQGGACAAKLAPGWHRSVKAAPDPRCEGVEAGSGASTSSRLTCPKTEPATLWDFVVVDLHWALLGLSETHRCEMCHFH